MKTHEFWWEFSQPAAATPTDWAAIGRFAWAMWNFVNVLDGGKCARWPEPGTTPNAATVPTVAAPTPPIVVMPRTPADAAALLGVAVDAGGDEVRAALRGKMANGAHPDHGGDARLAQQFIAAKNLLIENLRVPS